MGNQTTLLKDEQTVKNTFTFLSTVSLIYRRVFIFEARPQHEMRWFTLLYLQRNRNQQNFINLMKWNESDVFTSSAKRFIYYIFTFVWLSFLITPSCITYINVYCTIYFQGNSVQSSMDTIVQGFRPTIHQMHHTYNFSLAIHNELQALTNSIYGQFETENAVLTWFEFFRF